MKSSVSSAARPGPSAYWKRNLAFIWISQFVAMMGFSYGLPFVAYFMQTDLHVSQSDLPFWLAAFGAASPLTMTVFAPVWGALADRYGRRIMLLRAYFGGLIVLSLMGVAQSVVFLVFLRLIQGALSGSVSASQTLVATHTPSRHSGFALGALNSAVFSGSLAGAFLGGWTAEHYGYRTAFILSGGLMLISLTLIFFGVREKFVPPKKLEGETLFASLKVEPTQLKIVLPILLLMAGVMFVRQFDSSYIAVLVQTIRGSLEGASILSGILFAASGIAGVVSGFVMGWLADRFSPGMIAIFSAFATAFLILPHAFVTTVNWLFLMRFMMVFMGGGLEPVLQIWLCKKTPPESRGLVFGWAASIRSMGWMFAPLCGGLVFEYAGVFSLFVVESFLYCILIICIWFAKRLLERLDIEEEKEKETEDMISKIDNITIIK